MSSDERMCLNLYRCRGPKTPSVVAGCRAGGRVFEITIGIPEFYAMPGGALLTASTSTVSCRGVCDGTVRGLEAAQGLSGARDGGWGSTLLAGLVVTVPVAKEPKVLSDARKLVMSAAPRAWTFPFIPGLAVEGVPQKFPRAYTKLVRELGEFLNASST